MARRTALLSARLFGWAAFALVAGCGTPIIVMSGDGPKPTPRPACAPQEPKYLLLPTTYYVATPALRTFKVKVTVTTDSNCPVNCSPALTFLGGWIQLKATQGTRTILSEKYCLAKRGSGTQMQDVTIPMTVDANGTWTIAKNDRSLTWSNSTTPVDANCRAAAP